MPADSEDRVQQWARVPGGSVLKISVLGTTEDVSILATIDALDSDNNVTVRPLDTDTGLPGDVPIVKGKRYSVDVLLNYQTAGTAKVHAEIRTREGNLFGKVFDSDLTGTANSEEFVSFFVFALRE